MALYIVLFLVIIGILIFTFYPIFYVLFMEIGSVVTDERDLLKKEFSRSKEEYKKSFNSEDEVKYIVSKYAYLCQNTSIVFLSANKVITLCIGSEEYGEDPIFLTKKSILTLEENSDYDLTMNMLLNDVQNAKSIESFEQAIEDILKNNPEIENEYLNNSDKKETFKSLVSEVKRDFNF